MPRVAALYRYPIKGLTPESRDSLMVLPSGRIAGDRVLGLRFADTDAADDAWSPKHGMLVLMNTPGLAQLQVELDEPNGRIRARFDDGDVVETGLDPEGRQRFALALERYALGLDENPLTGHTEHLPLRLVGDGTTPRFHDNEAGEATLHGRASLVALAHAAGEPELSELRFRSNIAIEGPGAWEELDWIGRRIRIGSVELEVTKTKVRCLATHANPVSGTRDLAMMHILADAFGQERPTFGISLRPTDSGGEIRLGDEVTVV